MSQQFNFEDLFGGKPLAPVLRPEEYLPPRSRTKDPESSKRAEAEVKRSGAMSGGRKLALDLVTQYPGRSSKQLAELGQADRHMIARRLADLRHMKLVHTTQNGRDDMQWWPNDQILGA
jgi:hypothetical protein